MEHPERLIQSADRETARILQLSLSGRDLGEPQLARLLQVRGEDQAALLATADLLRRQSRGDDVTYVVNRNINFTNVCVKRCSFCAFSRTKRSSQGYLLPVDEVVRRACEAWKFGASEVCIQAGLVPDMPGDLYIRICRAVKEALPEIHIHAFSPEEILYGVQRSGGDIRGYLSALKQAGIGSLPGTSAEVLDQEVRDRISRGRISVKDWIEVVTTAHSLGIPTTSTLMYGHVETPRQSARHLLLLRDLQRRSGGFSEFVPLGFVHREAPMYTDGLVDGVRPGASADEVLNMHAVARLALDRDIPNIQVSWVKEGLEMAKRCLEAGVNDLGGTLINESISTSAGASHGQLVRPVDLRRLIRSAGRVPVERSTLYQPLRRFENESGDDAGPLDSLSDEEARRFGSYFQLVETERFRYA